MVVARIEHVRVGQAGESAGILAANQTLLTLSNLHGRLDAHDDFRLQGDDLAVDVDVNVQIRSKNILAEFLQHEFDEIQLLIHELTTEQRLHVLLKELEILEVLEEEA